MSHGGVLDPPGRSGSGRTPGRTPGPAALSRLQPMLAQSGHPLPVGPGWVFEPKYDGMRVLAFVDRDGVRIVSRTGANKTVQFPEVAAALESLSARAARGTARRAPADGSIVLDGELVALQSDGTPARFQQLQGRLHLTRSDAIAQAVKGAPVALIVFDCIADGGRILLGEPWHERRRRLEALLRGRRGASARTLRLAEVLGADGDGDRLLASARRAGWEGLLAKRRDAPYEPGRRSSAWRKVKLENRQELVVGGWTEPRGSRAHLGALLLGYFAPSRETARTRALRYAGHTGTGLTGEALRVLRRRLAPLERPTPPFDVPPRTNEPAHWVEPRVVVEVRFNEWTAAGKLRQPVFVGVRDDVEPESVRREPVSVEAKESAASGPATPRGGSSRGGSSRRESGAGRAAPSFAPGPKRRQTKQASSVVDQLTALEEDGADGIVRVGRDTLGVTNLRRIVFPETGWTKGDLLRYYARVAGYILPALADRPLQLQRFPQGVGRPAFYQQHLREAPPPGVRVDVVAGESEPRLIGGDLLTVLWAVQQGAISIDAWHGRVQSPRDADYSIIDLDPGPRATFERVIEVARRVRGELDRLGLTGVPKTSGSRGLHVAVPLVPGTPGEAARLLAEIVATRVAHALPSLATIERAVKRRAADAVYVDFLQNIPGKTIASVYAARARAEGTVSTPLAWEEVAEGLDPRAFTIATVPERLATVGDLWAAGLKKRHSLRRLAALAGDA